MVILLTCLVGFLNLDSVFSNYTGFWVAREDYVEIPSQFEREVSLTVITAQQKETVTRLSSSIYGSQDPAFQNISNNRYVIFIQQ